MNNKKYHMILIVIYFIFFIWSVIQPYDFFTWFLEVSPAVIGLGILLITYQKFKFTNFTYNLILLHSIILMIGGHYTYAEVPLFNWLKDVFDLNRNYYDRLGHYAQGFIPAIIAREILFRKSIIKNGHWMFFIITCICLAISASYELLEFGVAMLTVESAEAFLGTQGDVWDYTVGYAICIGRRHFLTPIIKWLS
ncbi:putative sodium-glucose/galactose cotransporter [Desulforamulus reducens MI-1]|uniref:Putative sodium-glucose/galactose cotransporter n=1 Tax=Desulforamulus reducens (strain ATCC BAA-1160 / DSM 100696 / MI-1) TaxID=349161 RepID=A4J7T9_DESRM|nr:putative sodium-glucose/galactose cotransporter [Desulforamulus reducens MI-1]